METTLKFSHEKKEIFMDNKVVYFAGAIRGDRMMANNMRILVSFIQGLGLKVLTEHVVAEDPIETFANKLGKAKDSLSAEDIERQDIAWLDEATHVIAEISGASTGTGREIEYARTKKYFGKIPAKVLVLYTKEREFFASPMIRGMTVDRYPNMTIEAYTTLDEAQRIIQQFLSK